MDILPLGLGNDEHAAVPDRTSELEQQLAASEAARAELISKLNQVEQALAMTQLSLLNAERRATEAEAESIQSREDPTRPSPPAPTVVPEDATVADELDTVEIPHTPESDRRDVDDEPSAPTSLMDRIAELRDAVESAAGEMDVTPPENTDAPSSFRERLTRAADARHRPAS
jgi:hypothetical protein